MDILVNSDDTNEMQHNAPFQQGQHCSLSQLKQPSGVEIHNNLENATSNPF